jgi:hypothetical protein
MFTHSKREERAVSSMSASGGSVGPEEAVFHGQRAEAATEAAGRGSSLCSSSHQVLVIPPTLLEHVRRKVQDGLAARSASDAPTETAQALVDAMLWHPECSSNKAVMQMGERLGKAVRYCALLPLPEERAAAAAAVGQILAQYAEYIKSNNQIYDSITTHHANITQEDWGDVAADQEALSRYAAAAAAMGTKAW